jgi:hypothetical protein
MKCFFYLVVACSVFFFLGTGSAISAPMQLGTAACEKIISEPSVNEIVREVFEKKAAKLEKEGKLSRTFWAKNKDLIFTVCDNRASYDTFVVYGKGVVFDYQMVAFLFAQSRALIVGRYISLTQQFDVHAELVRQFVEQGPALDGGPLAIIEKKALELGMSKPAFDIMLADPEFQRREQTFFLQAMYFLAMHERCHVALDHRARLDEIQHLPDAEQLVARQRLELDADRCALDIINSDEAQFKSSPVSFFGVLMTVATQSIIANQPSLMTERSHPSTRDRMASATDITLDYISKSDSALAQTYESTIRGTVTYFNALLAGPHF